MIAHYPDRTFRLWEFNVTHSRLLLRSAKGPEFERNIDVKFYAVDYVSFPTILRGLSIEHGGEQDMEDLVNTFDFAIVEPSKCFALRSGGNKYFVVAVHVKVDENDLGWFDSPFTRLSG